MASCPVMQPFAGCTVVYAPMAQKVGVQFHEQSSSNMVITESVPLTAKLADSLTGISAGNNNSAGNGNSITGVAPSVSAKLK